MATINCPHGSRWVTHFAQARFTWENRAVEIFEGICDHCDQCGVQDCEYFDNSRAATRRFLRAQANAHTLEGLLADQRYQDELRRKHQRRFSS